MKKNKWKRVPLNVIRNNEELLSKFLDKYNKEGPCWPYMCGNAIKWKYGNK